VVIPASFVVIPAEAGIQSLNFWILIFIRMTAWLDAGSSLSWNV
jgi:hypothetical protein